MFARAVHVTAGGTIAAAAIALVFGSACKCPDSFGGCGNDWILDSHSGYARGVNVVPPAADTSGRAAMSFNSATLAYSYNVIAAPSGTVDSIALYEVDAGQALPASP